MHVAHALALRRLAVAAAALAASLVAHVAATGELHLTPAAPVLWATLLLTAVMCGRRRRFLPRSIGRTALVLALMQAGVHIVMTDAPWALGLAAHDAGAPILDVRSLAVHAAAAVVLVVLLGGLDRCLAAAVAVVRLLIGDPPPARAFGGAGERVVQLVRAPRPRIGAGAMPARGPPGVRPPAAVSIG